MATYAPAVYTSVADQVNYIFAFETIDKSDVYVKLNGTFTYDFTITNYTTSGGGTVVLVAAPEVGTEVIVCRQTDISSMDATFISGSAIRAQDLNGDFTQLRNAIQETESNIETINYSIEKNIILNNKKLFEDKIILDAGVGDGRHLEIFAKVIKTRKINSLIFITSSRYKYEL